jgi:hypothetical protein
METSCWLKTPYTLARSWFKSSAISSFDPGYRRFSTLIQDFGFVARHMLSNDHKLRPRSAGTLVAYLLILALRRSCTAPGRATILEVSMRKSLVILIGALGAAGTLQAAPATQSANTTRNEIPSSPTQQHQVVMTAKWGFEAPNLFPLDPQEVQSYGGTTRPGPRNSHLSASHGGLVTAVDRSSLPGRE